MTDLWLGVPDFSVGQELGAADLDELGYALHYLYGDVNMQDGIYHQVRVLSPEFEGSDAAGAVLRHMQATVGAGTETATIFLEGMTEGDGLESGDADEWGDALDIIGRLVDDADSEQMGRIRFDRTDTDQGRICIDAATDDGAGGHEYPATPNLSAVQIQHDGQVTIPSLIVPAILAPAVGTEEVDDSGEIAIVSYTVPTGRTGRHRYDVFVSVLQSARLSRTFTGHLYFTRAPDPEDELTGDEVYIPTFTPYFDGVAVPAAGYFYYDGLPGDILTIKYERTGSAPGTSATTVRIAPQVG